MTGLLNKIIQLMKKIPRRAHQAGFLVGAIVVVVIGILVINKATNSNQRVMRSEEGKISLFDTKPEMSIKEGLPIRGSFTPQEGASLYYIVSSDDKRALGAGNIVAGKDNQFSRNLAFNAQDYIGKTGELQVYMQGQNGNRIDGLTIKVKFE